MSHYSRADDDDDDDNDDDASFRVESEEDDEKPKARRRTTPTLTTKKRKIVMRSGDDEDSNDAATNRKPKNIKALRRVDFDAMDDTTDLLPSQDRLTDRGGYFHTKSSRMKISQANAGNVPWNAGKNRSAQDKAKIGAAVRARNSAILSIKLQKLGLSEEEWWALKKKLKLVREKVRKARYAVKVRKENFEKEKQKKAMEQPERKLKDESVWGTVDSGEDDCENEEDEDDGAAVSSDANLHEGPMETINTYEDFVAAFVASNTEPEGPSRARLPVHQQLPPSIVPFAKNHSWAPHPFDRPDISYSMMCSYGGPGGLICCEACASSYSGFLTKTVKDMEQQHLKQLGSEVKELLEFTIRGKQILAESVKVARRTPVPLHGGATMHFDRWTNSSRKLKDPPHKAPRKAQGVEKNSYEDEETGPTKLADLVTQTAMI